MTPSASLNIAREALRRDGGYIRNYIDITRDRGLLKAEHGESIDRSGDGLHPWGLTLRRKKALAKKHRVEPEPPSPTYLLEYTPNQVRGCRIKHPKDRFLPSVLF